MRRLYWSSRNLPELSQVPEHLRYGAMSVAIQRAHRHWQVWVFYFVLFGGIYFLPRWDVHPGRLVFNVASALYVCVGGIACRIVLIHFARRYIE
jgi:hypothetical protein